MIQLPKHFYDLTRKQQDDYLSEYLIKYHKVTDEIKKLLGIIRGHHRKVSEDDVN